MHPIVIRSLPTLFGSSGVPFKRASKAIPIKEVKIQSARSHSRAAIKYVERANFLKEEHYGRHGERQDYSIWKTGKTRHPPNCVASFMGVACLL